MAAASHPRVAIGLPVIAAVVAVAWAVLSSGDSDPGDARDETGPAPTEIEGANERDVPSARTTIPVAAEAGNHVRGRVELPAATPADDECFVGAFIVDGSVGAAGRAAESALAKGSITSEGEFDLSIPASGAVDLDLLSRYLFLRHPVRVDVPAGDAIVLRPCLGGWLRGRLVRPAGARTDPGADDAGGITVVLAEGYRTAGPASGIAGEGRGRAARTSADGTFEFRGVRPFGTFVIEVDPGPPWAPERRAGLEIRPGERLDLEIGLHRGATVTGIVVDVGGTPLEGARVQVVDATSDRAGAVTAVTPRVLATAASESDGSFVIPGLPAGLVRVWASREGFADGFSLAYPLSEGRVKSRARVTLEEVLDVRGIVTWPDQTPAGGAEIRIARSAAWAAEVSPTRPITEPGVHVTADARGVFSVHGLAPSVYEAYVTATRATAGAPEYGHAMVNSLDPRSEDRLRIELQPVSAFTARVEDESHRPVRRFRVHARCVWASRRVPFEAERRAECEDDAGRLTLAGLAPGTWAVDVESVTTGAAAGPIEVVVPGRDGERSGEERVITLRARGGIEGRVVDPDGRAVAGAEVVVRNVGSGFVPLLVGDVPRGVITDADGRFGASGLAAGEIVIAAAAQGFARSEDQVVVVPPGGTADPVAFTLRTGVTVVGRAYTRDGAPAAGREVHASPTPWETWSSVIDARGAFKFDRLVPGEIGVSAYLGTGPRDTLDSEPGGPRPDVEGLVTRVVSTVDGDVVSVVLGETGAEHVRVFGTVTSVGAPVAAELTFRAEGPRDFASSSARPISTRSSVEAGYQVELSRPGNYLLSVSVPDAQLQTSMFVTIPAVSEHALDVGLPSSSLSGHVFDGRGFPLNGVPIALQHAGGIPNTARRGGVDRTTQTDSAGAYAFRMVLPGEYTLRAGSAGGDATNDSARRAIALKTGIVLRAGESLDQIDFTLSGAQAVTGTVTGPAGDPVEGATVFARDATGNVLEPLSFVRTDSLGRFRYDGLSPGGYSFSARTGTSVARDCPSVAVTLDAPPAPIALMLESGAILEVVSERHERPVAAEVRVVDVAGRSMGGLMTDHDVAAVYREGRILGTSRIGPVPGGSYSIEARDAGGAVAVATVDAVAGGEHRVVLRFDGD